MATVAEKKKVETEKASEEEEEDEDDYWSRLDLSKSSCDCLGTYGKHVC